MIDTTWSSGDPVHDQLATEAVAAAANSYNPYSRFAVGAAALLSDGGVVHGCNVENASYGLTVCAERCAIFSAVARGYTKADLVALALARLSADASHPQTAMPCGACRQVMRELLVDDAPVVVVGVGTFANADLLPTPFQLL